jgi:hypothetical protein
VSRHEHDELTSKKLSPALYTSTKTSPGPGVGSGVSSERVSSLGCAYRLITYPRIARVKWIDEEQLDHQFI